MQKGTDLIYLAATIDPDAYTAAAYTSDWVPARNGHQYVATVFAGTLGTNATIDAKIQQATDSSGTGAKDVSGLSITQLTQAGSDDDKQALINIDPVLLDVANGFNHFAVVVTVGTATSDMGAAIFGVYPRSKPTTGFDLASVDEIV